MLDAALDDVRRRRSMADIVIALPRRPRDAELLEWYRHLIEPSGGVDEYSQLIAPDRLSTLRCTIEIRLTPASRADVARAVAVISVSFKIPGPGKALSAAGAR